MARLDQVTPPSPSLEFLARFEVELGEPLEVGETGGGRRRIIPIVGGRFRGPRLSGRVLPGGADWQLVEARGVARIDTRYALETDDGALVFISTRGVRHGPPEVIAALARGEWVDPGRYYFRVTLRFETGAPAYDWLNRAVAVGAAVRLPAAVVYDAFLVT
ncbi:MAG TPA: DUF3237 domain-containing protein [Candidatus Dormibacteraeota bacterium]|nr:DUF3237 domain-containing protein [Candidatus Dormibacteraeota bacterium]